MQMLKKGGVNSSQVPVLLALAASPFSATSPRSSKCLTFSDASYVLEHIFPFKEVVLEGFFFTWSLTQRSDSKCFTKMHVK